MKIDKENAVYYGAITGTIIGILICILFGVLRIHEK